MSASILLALQIIAILPKITVGVEQLVAWIRGVREASQQSGEWTPDMEAAFRQALLDTADAPEYKPDDQ